jgi:hypothetical protein
MFSCSFGIVINQLGGDLFSNNKYNKYKEKIKGVLFIFFLLNLIIVSVSLWMKVFLDTSLPHHICGWLMNCFLCCRYLHLVKYKANFTSWKKWRLFDSPWSWCLFVFMHNWIECYHLNRWGTSAVRTTVPLFHQY